MKSPTIETGLQALTNSLAARWWSLDEQAQQQERFSFAYARLQERKAEIYDVFYSLENLYQSVSNDFLATESERFANLTIRRPKSDDVKGPR